MLEARDYFVAHDWTTATLADFQSKVGRDREEVEEYVLVATKIGNSKNRVCVFFPQGKVNKTVYVSLRNKALKLDGTGVILCCNRDMTGATKQMISADPLLNVEYFADWKFLVNLPDHDFVPNHIVLTGESFVSLVFFLLAFII